MVLLLVLMAIMVVVCISLLTKDIEVEPVFPMRESYYINMRN